jgi:superfamily II DNA or RNA helicase
MRAPTLDRALSPDGVRFRFTLEDGRQAPTAFPLDEGEAAQGSPAIRLLESLWYEDRLDEKEGAYLLPVKEIYRLDRSARRELDLSAEPTEVDIEVRTSGYAGSDDFAIRPVVRLPSVGIVTSGQRTGPFLVIDGETRLVPEPAARLLQELDTGASNDVTEQLLHIGRVKELADEAGARLDDYLTGQEIEVPEGITVEAEAVGSDEIQLRPVPVGADFDLGTGKTKSSYFKTEDDTRRRLVLTDEQRKTADEVKRRSQVQGKDVPKFLDNPEAFVPDEIDLEVFSLRVKGVVPRRYNSQPYVQLQEGESRDWFDADIEIDSVPTADGTPATGAAPGEEGGPPRAGEPDGPSAPPADGDTPTPDLAPDEFAELCREVVETGDRHVMHKGDWIEVDPDRAEAYLDAWDRLDEDERGSFRLPKSDKDYVLDVISNVHELEFAEDGEPEHTFVGELPEYSDPALFDGTLRSYQVTGYRWLRYLHEEDYGGLLADDMGLGKTVQVIALMAHLAENEELAPALLVVPAAVMDNWHEEIERFCPSIEYIYHHRGADRKREPARIEMCPVVLTTYATLRRDQLALGQVDWSLIACDEAQKVKNPTAQRTSAVKAMKSPLKLALTGTPVENGLSELWCIVDYAQPGRLGSRKGFRQEFERPIQEGAETQAERMELANRLQERLTPHYLRRVKEEVLEDLPERKPDRRIGVPMSPSQERLYAQIRDSVRSGAASPLGALQNLKQVCSHPDLYTGQMREPAELVARCPKLDATLSLVDEVRGRDEKVLIYTEYHHMQRILQECLRDRFGIHVPILNGEVRTGRRHQRVQRFNADAGFGAMLLGPESAGVGLNITGANNVIHYTRLWNPAKESQATDRVYRIGQERPVQVYYPIVEGDGFTSMEEHLDELLREKEKLAKDVVWPRENLSVRGDMQGWMEATDDG